PTLGWSLEGRVGYSGFDESLGFLDFGDVDFRSRVDQVTWRADLVREFGPALTLRFGGAADRLRHRNFAEAGGTTFLDWTGSGTLGAVYASARWRPSTRWIVEPGVRADTWFGDTEPTVV